MRQLRDSLAHALLTVLATGLGVLLILAALTPAGPPSALPAQLRQTMPYSGVEHPVTAVLLNFRGFDTLLEIGVLLLAAIAVLILIPDKGSRGHRPLSAGPTPGPLVPWLLPRLLPMALMTGLYLWWAGASRPGGAFQAGTVLAAGIVLALLGQSLGPPRVGARLRLGMVLGFVLFCAFGLGSGLAAPPMAYPAGWAKALILLIELALMVSIALIFMVLVIGIPPHARGRFPGDAP
ncbi:MnhB domain-containing protein [Alkalilimnicola sp. S0819]|uniref:MnhB domain-containing protein n=1 Tax=Alkalilimnicola sp. S0819 TaxID=2613922 RepID=UPI001261916F|nr:MnhB domain-containing protein [Alkalilimnicola sp. S0819]KAB7627479.1 sodium:proton antiporter [Alkalilimnicola sp. S0819]MPQ15631.1 sodium:proton antiporter [Alkalilimnicola sp. S0819]